MTKRMLALLSLTLLTGCLPGASALTGVAVPGGALTGGLTTVSNAELDALIACAKTKPAGAAFVNGWGAIKTTVAEGQRGVLKPAIEAQAKAIGCL